MSKSQLRSYAPLFHSIQKCPSNACRAVLFSHLDGPSFQYVLKWLRHCVQDPQVLNLKPRQLKKLKEVLGKDRERLKYLTRNGIGSVSRTRRAVKQSGEGIGLLLGILAPVIIDLVTKIVNKGKK